MSLFGGFATKLSVRGSTSFESIYSFGTPVVGIGFWPLFDNGFAWARAFRINYGMMWFEQKNGNPLLDSKIRTHAPVLSVTVNTSLAPALVPLAALIGVPKRCVESAGAISA